MRLLATQLWRDLRTLLAGAGRGGASLPMPEQEIVLGDDGHYALRYRPPLPAEDYTVTVPFLGVRSSDGAALKAAGGHPFDAMAKLPALVGS